MSANNRFYSIQQTYILTHVLTPKREIVTCNQRIDIPTIEPLTGKKVVVYPDEFMEIVPCIELAGNFLTNFKLTFETNEGVTVLPIEISPGVSNPLDNPYMSFRHVLVLPRGATGVKSCKIINNVTKKEVQHNFTFGIMPPPYNYDNALFGHLSYRAKANYDNIRKLEDKVNHLTVKTSSNFSTIDLPKGAGKQTINIEDGVLFYEILFSYKSLSEPTTHKPKITLHGAGRDWIYTLSLNKTTNTVSIDLFTGMLRVCDVKGEITQQFMLKMPNAGYETLSFENFDDIDASYLYVTSKGARVK